LVTLTFFNSGGVETTEGAADATVFTYTIEVPTAIARPSVENIMLVPVTSASPVEFVYSADI